MYGTPSASTQDLQPTTKELVSHVKQQAAKWYDKGWCWDYVLECLSTEDIVRFIGKATTPEGAVRNVFKNYVKPLQNQRANTAW